MTNTVAVDDELCKEYAFSLLRMARNSKHPNPRISALRSIGRLQLSSNHVLDDEEVCREVIFTIDEAWKNQMITALEKEMLVVVTQKLLQSIEVRRSCSPFAWVDNIPTILLCCMTP
jgi:hypothetical protein